MTQLHRPALLAHSVDGWVWLLMLLRAEAVAFTERVSRHQFPTGLLDRLVPRLNG